MPGTQHMEHCAHACPPPDFHTLLHTGSYVPVHQGEREGCTQDRVACTGSLLLLVVSKGFPLPCLHTLTSSLEHLGRSYSPTLCRPPHHSLAQAVQVNLRLQGLPSSPGLLVVLEVPHLLYQEGQVDQVARHVHLGQLLLVLHLDHPYLGAAQCWTSCCCHHLVRSSVYGVIHLLKFEVETDISSLPTGNAVGRV